MRVIRFTSVEIRYWGYVNNYIVSRTITATLKSVDCETTGFIVSIPLKPLLNPETNILDDPYTHILNPIQLKLDRFYVKALDNNNKLKTENTF